MSIADDPRYDAIRDALATAAESSEPAEALPLLRAAADRLTDLIDDTMAQALVTGRTSLRSVGARPHSDARPVCERERPRDGVGRRAGEVRPRDRAHSRARPRQHRPGAATTHAVPSEEDDMTRSDLTHLYVLLDRSGSMQSIKSDIVGGFDAFVVKLVRIGGDKP